MKRGFNNESTARRLAAEAPAECVYQLRALPMWKEVKAAERDPIQNEGKWLNTAIRKKLRLPAHMAQSQQPAAQPQQPMQSQAEQLRPVPQMPDLAMSRPAGSRPAGTSAPDKDDTPALNARIAAMTPAELAALDQAAQEELEKLDPAIAQRPAALESARRHLLRSGFLPNATALLAITALYGAIH